MKKITRITSLLLTISIIFTTITTAGAVNYGEEYNGMPTITYEQKFNDVPTSHWAFNSIGEMYNRGVVSGYPNGNFYPDNTVTRAEFARIMTSASGLQISQPSKKDFEDVATDAWYAPYVHAAYPYLSGYQVYGGNYYKPDTPALREDIAVALVKLKGYDIFGADESILQVMFKDYQSISADARKYVAIALERGLVSGYEDDTFRGQSSISRAEATAMLWRAYQYGNDNKTFDIINTPIPQIATVEPTIQPTNSPEPTKVPEKPYIIDTIDSYGSSRVSTSDGENIYFYDDVDNIIYKVNDEKSIYLDLNSFELSDGDDTLLNCSVEGLYYDEQLFASILFRNKKNPGGLKDKEFSGSKIVDITDPENPLVINNVRGNIQCIMSNGNIIVNDIMYESNGESIAAIHLHDDTSAIYTAKDSNIYCISNSNKFMQYDFGSSKWNCLRDIHDEYEKYAMYVSLYKDEFYLLYHDGSMIKCDLNGNLTKLDFNAINDCEIVDFIPYPDKVSRSEKVMYITDSGLYFFDSSSHKIRIIKER